MITLYDYRITDTFLQITLPEPRTALSSAIFNGGLGSIDGLLNLKVPQHTDAPPAPQQTLAQFIQQQQWRGRYVGKMTAASMGSFRQASHSAASARATAFVTTGLANAKRAGEPAEEITANAPAQTGTINMVVIVNQAITTAALAEAFMVATEAKTAVLHSLNIPSAYGDGIATGTGTDALTIVSGPATPQTLYAGKHTALGEAIGRSVMDALTASLQWYTTDAPGGPL